jgi:hypothetical protein
MRIAFYEIVTIRKLRRGSSTCNGRPKMKFGSRVELQLNRCTSRICSSLRTHSGQVLETFPNQFQEVRKNNRFGRLLRYRNTWLLISLTFARRSNRGLGRSWIIETPRAERKHTTVLVLLDVRGSGIESIWVFPNMPIPYRHLRVREGDAFLASGLRVEKLSELVGAIRSIRMKASAQEHDNTY